MDHARGVVAGPLSPYEQALRAELTRTGYAASSVRDVVGTMGRLSAWLQETGRSAAELTPSVAEEFLVLRRQRCSSEMAAARGLGPLLRFLRAAGVVSGVNRPGFRAAFRSWEGWRDAEQVRQGSAGEGGRAGS